MMMMMTLVTMTMIDGVKMTGGRGSRNDGTFSMGRLNRRNFKSVD